MSLAHVMRQTRGVGDEERGHWLMSCLPNAPPLSLRGTFAPVRGKLHWSQRLMAGKARVCDPGVRLAPQHPSRGSWVR